MAEYIKLPCHWKGTIQHIRKSQLEVSQLMQQIQENYWKKRVFKFLIWTQQRVLRTTVQNSNIKTYWTLEKSLWMINLIKFSSRFGLHHLQYNIVLLTRFIHLKRLLVEFVNVTKVLKPQKRFLVMLRTLRSLLP